mmetsp:Transcript_23309/g.50682  ORF Transcript_23309/g.50682 Transcript_23309/m.50682 type:complete len:190 (+) Transcript_23309:136-705(+)
MASPASTGLLPTTRDEEGVFSLCPFPPSSSSSTAIALYGGDDGTVYLLPPDVDDKQRQQQPKAVRAFDDAVRSIAVSSDGIHVAVGFDGSTEVDDGSFRLPPGSSGGDGSLLPALHPFLATAASNASSATTGGDNANANSSNSGGDDDGIRAHRFDSGIGEQVLALLLISHTTKHTMMVRPHCRMRVEA